MIIDGFQQAISAVPNALLNQLVQPPLEIADDECIYSKVFKPILGRCQSSFMWVPTVRERIYYTALGPERLVSSTMVE